MLPVVQRFHLQIFQCFGFHTISLPLQQRHATASGSCQSELWLQLWNCLLLTGFTVLALVAICADKDVLFVDDRFGHFNDFMKFTIGEIAVATSYVESLCRRSALKKFWRLYCQLQLSNTAWQQASASAPTPPMDHHDWRPHTRFLCIFYVNAATDLILGLIFWLTQIMERHMFRFWVAFQPFVWAVHMRNMHFIFHIELIRLELVQLEQELQLLGDYSRFASTASFSRFNEFLRRKLLEKNLIYQRIYEMYISFQDAFGYSILAVLLMLYVRILVDSYFMYYTFYRKWPHIDFILLVPAVLQIPSFIYSSKSCMDMHQKLTYELHNVASHLSYNAAISLQLQNFSSQMLHMRIRIDGLGMPPLDGYMLTRAVGSITTYMIFFIQFMPKISNF